MTKFYVDLEEKTKDDPEYLKGLLPTKFFVHYYNGALAVDVPDGNKDYYSPLEELVEALDYALVKCAIYRVKDVMATKPEEDQQ